MKKPFSYCTPPRLRLLDSALHEVYRSLYLPTTSITILYPRLLGAALTSGSISGHRIAWDHDQLPKLFDR